jgi:hypothetical protein
MTPTTTNHSGHRRPINELSQDQKNDFLIDVGLSRHELLLLHRYLEGMNAQKMGGNIVDLTLCERAARSCVRSVTERLRKHDGAPIFGSGIELRLQNERCGLCAGEYSGDILAEPVKKGDLGKALAEVKAVENRLHQIYQMVSGDKDTPPFIKGDDETVGDATLPRQW